MLYCWWQYPSIWNDDKNYSGERPTEFAAINLVREQAFIAAHTRYMMFLEYQHDRKTRVG